MYYIPVPTKQFYTENGLDIEFDPSTHRVTRIVIPLPEGDALLVKRLWGAFAPVFGSLENAPADETIKALMAFDFLTLCDIIKGAAERPEWSAGVEQMTDEYFNGFTAVKTKKISVVSMLKERSFSITRQENVSGAVWYVEVEAPGNGSINALGAVTEMVYGGEVWGHIEFKVPPPKDDSRACNLIARAAEIGHDEDEDEDDI